MATIPAGTKFLGVDPNFTDLTEKKGTKVDRKSEYFSLEDITVTVGVGSEGPQGVQGPAGPPGPVGPAGLEWQGAWDTDSSYALNDAVGFNGASWFCIAEVTGTGNPNPEVDTVSWALLAAQGATGPQGAQGPTGPQGPSGTAPTGTQGLVTASTSFPYPVLTNSLNQVLSTADNDSRVVLPTSTAIVGQKVVVSCIGGYKLLVKASQAGGGIYIDGVNNDLVNEFYIYPNETYEFTYNDNAEWISYFEEPKNKYKIYRAIVTQNDINDLEYNVLENTIGIVTINQFSTGIFLIKLPEGTDLSKVFLPNNLIKGFNPGFCTLTVDYIDQYSNSDVLLRTYENINNGFVFSDFILNKTPIEIIVYD